MSEASAAGSVARGAVLAAAGVGVLAVPMLPELARALAASGLVAAGAWWVASAGRERLDSVRARFVPPDSRTLARPALTAAPSPPASVPSMPAAPAPAAMPAPIAPAPVQQPSASAVAAMYAPPPARAPEPRAQPAAAGHDVVFLGPRADPAFPAFQLHWLASDGRTGVVPLPNGNDIKLGRHSESDIVVALNEVSRTHLLFAVSRTGVQVTDNGGSNGTYWNRGDGVWHKLSAKQPVALANWQQLRIAEPWAIVLTLEPAGH